MHIDISQNNLIDNLNKYLEWHNMPVKVNKAGICNALITIYTKYVLEGKEHEIMDLLSYVAGKKPCSEMEYEVNHFIIKIILKLYPEHFDKQLNQTSSIETQYINNKPLKPIFQLPLVTLDKNWEKIIADIKLGKDEVMTIGGFNHIVAVTRKEGRYVIFDPNYESGKKVFANESSLVHELHTKIFHFRTNEMGLDINLIRHPDKDLKDRSSLPKVQDIYNIYLGTSHVSKCASIGSITGSTLTIAAKYNNSEPIEILLNLGERNTENISLAAALAVKNNNPNVLMALIDHLTKKQLKELFILSLICGRKEIVDSFLTTDSVREFYNESLQDPVLFICAAEGGNLLLLKKVIEDSKKLNNLDDIKIAEIIHQKNNTEDTIMAGIRSNNTACLRFLLSQFEKVNFNLSEVRKMDYLVLAINKNQPQMVSLLIKGLSKEHLQTITLTLSAIQKTDLRILYLLEENGINFSETAKAVIAQKKHIPINHLLSIGIALIKFTDFINEFLFQKAGVNYDKNNSLFFVKKSAPMNEQENRASNVIPLEVSTLA